MALKSLVVKNFQKKGKNERVNGERMNQRIEILARVRLIVDTE